MICPKCGASNDNFQTVCLKCGKPLTPGFVMCPVCGKVIDDKTEICPRCHSNVNEKKLTKDINNDNLGATPRYIVKNFSSLVTSFLILCFMGYSLSYNIIKIIMKFDSSYKELSINEIIKLFVTTEIRPLVLFVLFILSATTFIKRVTINKLSTIEELNHRLVTLKCLLLADVFSYITYFMVSFWPNVFLENNGPYTIGAIIGGIILIFSVISLPLFYKRAKIRTR